MPRHSILSYKRIPDRLCVGVVILSTIRCGKHQGSAQLTSGKRVEVDTASLFEDDRCGELLTWLQEARDEWLRSINRVTQLIQRESPYRIGGPKQHPWHHSNYTILKLAAAMRAGDKVEL